jgi:hypothetical protein
MANRSVKERFLSNFPSFSSATQMARGFLRKALRHSFDIARDTAIQTATQNAAPHTGLHVSKNH